MVKSTVGTFGACMHASVVYYDLSSTQLATLKYLKYGLPTAV
jgi:hypothetical protein